VGLLLICVLATWIADCGPKAHCTSDNQATVTYVLQSPPITLSSQIWEVANKQLTPFSAETLYREFKRSTSTANQELQQFWKLMNDEESLKVLEQARKSRAENPNGIKPWKVTEHPDWATRGT
jgi:hypothetical protein